MVNQALLSLFRLKYWVNCETRNTKISVYWHAQPHCQNYTWTETRDATWTKQNDAFEQQVFFIGLGLLHIDDNCGLILGFSWGAVLPLRWISMEWTRSHFNFPRYLTWRHDTIHTSSSDHLINAEGSFLQHASLSKFMPALVNGPKVFIPLDHFFELAVFISNNAISEFQGFSVTLEKWTDPSEWKTFGDNMSEYQPALTCSL